MTILFPQHVGSLASVSYSPHVGNFLSGLYLKIQSQNYLRIYLHELLSFLTERGASSLCLLFNKNLEHLSGQSWQERVFLSVYANIYCQPTIRGNRGKRLNLHPNYLDISGLENVMQGMCMSVCFHMLVTLYTSSEPAAMLLTLLVFSSHGLPGCSPVISTLLLLSFEDDTEKYTSCH